MKEKEILRRLEGIQEYMRGPLMRLANNQRVNNNSNSKSREKDSVNSDFALLEDAEYDLRMLIFDIKKQL